MKQQYTTSKKDLITITICCTVAHIACFLLILNQTSDFPLFVYNNENDQYNVEHILSTGREAPVTTLLFHDEVSTVENPHLAHNKSKHAALAPVEQCTTATEGAALADTKRSDIPSQNEKKAVHEEESASHGYVESVTENAGYNYTAQTAKQLALQLYATNIWNIIKERFLINKSCLHITQAIDVQTKLQLSIHKTGRLLAVTLLYPSQYAALQQLEELIVHQIQKAQFPPFSSAIDKEQQTFSFALHIQGQPGLYAYVLSYQ